MPRLAHDPHRLHPAKRLFDPLALALAGLVAGVARGAPIDRRATVGVILGDMRHTAPVAAAGDEAGGVVVLVGADGASRSGVVLDHCEGGLTLGSPCGLAHPGVDDEPIA